LNGELRRGDSDVAGDDLCWSFGDDRRRELDEDGRKRVIYSGVSGTSMIGFNFLKDLIIRMFLSIEVDVSMKYGWNLQW
jgi:hypothetical protein